MVECVYIIYIYIHTHAWEYSWGEGTIAEAVPLDRVQGAAK